jgi:uncharacterized membrane protein YphA (DoxX/SURF4 family)
MEDRPSIPVALMRVVVGAAFIVAGAVQLTDHTVQVGNFQRWGLPSPDTLTYVAGGGGIVLGLILMLGILPRFAALLLLCAMVVALLTAGKTDGGPYYILPGLLAFLCLCLVLAGGGRWALVDRLDPAPPRQLIRTR